VIEKPHTTQMFPPVARFPGGTVLVVADSVPSRIRVRTTRRMSASGSSGDMGSEA